MFAPAQFCIFFGDGSNMVVFQAKADRKWQATFQRPLRYRVAGKLPSGLPNFPFSLFLPFPPFSSTYFPFSHFSPTFHLFTLSLLPFTFSLFFHNFPVIFLHLLSFSAFSNVFFFGHSDASPCDLFVSNVPHEAPPTHRTRHVLKEDFASFEAHSKKGS